MCKHSLRRDKSCNFVFTVNLTCVSASAVNIHKKRSSVSSDWEESDADMTIPLMLERREMRRSQQPGYTSRVQSTRVQTTAVTPYTPGLVRGQESMWRARPMKRMEPSRPAVAVVSSTSTLMCWIMFNWHHVSCGESDIAVSTCYQ